MSDEGEDIRPKGGGLGGTEIAVETRADADESEEILELPDVLPVLPLKNTVLFPHLLSPLLVNTKRSRTLIDEVLLRPDRLMACAAVKRVVEGSPGPDDVYRVGTVLRIVKMLKFPDDSYRLLVQGVARVSIDEFETQEPFMRGRVSLRPESGDHDSVEITALTRNVTQHFIGLVAESPRLSDELQLLAGNLEDPSKLADLVAHNLEFDVASKQTVLEEGKISERLKLVLSARDRDGDQGEGPDRDGSDAARLHAASAARGDSPRARRVRGG